MRRELPRARDRDGVRRRLRSERVLEARRPGRAGLPGPPPVSAEEGTMQRSKGGFTLTELMIAVGLIGALAALAIPNFVRYQNRARRSEAFTNVGSIATAEKSYFAEQGVYFEAPTQPVTTEAELNASQHAWTAAAASDFAGLGWKPEGPVRYSYDVNTG